MKFENSVFINCPFDKKYIDDILKPILFVLIRNGLNPRLALEISDSGQIRLEKITNIIKNCKYGIHDLSLVKSKKANEFARMNMPFELGIDYGLRIFDKNNLLHSKQFLILEANKYDYMKALSDINGFDIKVHNNDTEKVIECLYKWSSETLNINKQDPPLKIFYDYIDYNKIIFEEKYLEFKSEKLTLNYIENLSIPEYIEELKDRLNFNKN